MAWNKLKRKSQDVSVIAPQYFGSTRLLLQIQNAGAVGRFSIMVFDNKDKAAVEARCNAAKLALTVKTHSQNTTSKHLSCS